MSGGFLAVSGLTVVKGQREILNVPSLSVTKGEFLAITGPNGAGKSTLLKALAFLEPAKGDILVNGFCIRGNSETLKARRRMAFVFQDPLLLRGTALDNVTMGLRLRGIDKTSRLKKAKHWMDKLNIAHLADRDVRTLSGGEAQRVNLARAMSLEPDVLFLDEPFTYLDVPSKAALISELKQILTDTKTTTLMVTHDLSDVPFLADRMMVIIEGRIRQVGPVAEVLARPKSRQLAEFLGVENIWSGRVGQGSVSFLHLSLEGADRKLSLLPDAIGPEEIDSSYEQLACIRPEYVLVLTEPPGGAPEPNTFKGKIEAVYPYGYYYRVKVNVGFMVTALVGAVQFPKLPQKGDQVWVSVPPEKIHVIPAVVS